MYMYMYVLIFGVGTTLEDGKTCVREEEVGEGGGISAYLAVY